MSISRLSVFIERNKNNVKKKLRFIGGGRAAAAWLANGAWRPDDLLTGMCERFSAFGVPLWRLSVFVRTLDPRKR
jgi:hypothetical protein